MAAGTHFSRWSLWIISGHFFGHPDDLSLEMNDNDDPYRMDSLSQFTLSVPVSPILSELQSVQPRDLLIIEGLYE